MTPLLRRLWALAKKHRLPNALGRAVCLANRHYNTGVYGWDQEELAYMRKVRPQTADRWLTHWCVGGSLKSLRYSEGAYRKLRQDWRRKRSLTPVQSHRWWLHP